MKEHIPKEIYVDSFYRHRAGVTIGNYTTNRTESSARYVLDDWQSMDSAPRGEKLFVLRSKKKPHVTCEAMIYSDNNGWEDPEEYYVLQNMTIDESIDGDWDDFEWKPI